MLEKICGWKMMIRAKKEKKSAYLLFLKFQNIFVSNNLEYALKFPACKDDS